VRSVISNSAGVWVSVIASEKRASIVDGLFVLLGISFQGTANYNNFANLYLSAQPAKSYHVMENIISS
jgi:hypothetical protein